MNTSTNTIKRLVLLVFLACLGNLDSHAQFLATVIETSEDAHGKRI